MILTVEHLRNGFAHERVCAAPEPACRGQRRQQLFIAAAAQPVVRERRLEHIGERVAEPIECVGEVHHASILARATDIQRPRSEALYSCG